MVKLRKVLQADALAPRHFNGKDCLAVAGYTDFKGIRRKRRNRITDLRKMLTSARRRDSAYSETTLHSIITEPSGDGTEYCRYCRMISADASEYCTYCRSTTDPAGRRDVFAAEYSKFLSTGRSGRRNAMLPNPAEEQQHAHPAVYHLSDRFKELSTVADQPGTSNQDPSTPGTSKQHG